MTLTDFEQRGTLHWVNNDGSRSGSDEGWFSLSSRSSDIGVVVRRKVGGRNEVNFCKINDVVGFTPQLLN